MRSAVDNFLHDRVGPLVEQTMGQERRILKQLVGRHSQSVGQSMQGPRMRLATSAENCFDRSLVEPRGFDHLLQGHPRAGHESADVRGEIEHDGLDRIRSSGPHGPLTVSP